MYDLLWIPLWWFTHGILLIVGLFRVTTGLSIKYVSLMAVCSWKSLGHFRIMLLLLLSCFSCVRLCDPIDGSPPGSPVPGILQARTQEWVAISFSNAWKWKVKGKSLSCVRLAATPWTAALQAPPSMDPPGKSTGVGCQHLMTYSKLKLSGEKSHCQRTKGNLFVELILICLLFFFSY